MSTDNSTHPVTIHQIIRWILFFIFKLLILESWQTQLSSSEAVRSQGKVPGWLEKPVLAPTGSIRTVQLPKRQHKPGS